MPDRYEQAAELILECIEQDALSYCRAAEQKVSMPTLFDLMAQDGDDE